MHYRPLLLSASALLLACLSTHTATAQETAERRKRHYTAQARPYYRGPVRFTLGGGVALYNGDLAENLANNLPGPSGSLGLLYMVRPHLVVGGEFTYFQLGAKDQLPERGLAFQGRNESLVGFVRYELLRDEGEYAGARSPAALIKPYVKAGLGFLLYNPKAYRGNLRPTPSTEYLPPEVNDYPATAIVAPVGLGLVFRLTPKLNATAEGAYYFTTTDRLDDVSQRGNASLKDGYGLVELKLEYAPWGR
ncbi:Outer membrane protein beta-barrel domain-containing protein [Hymenobacter daecheongensis DSM 21074]|uniref:Outer membrane protein beta-barrel domain-containing protein n=1 Tax=Hymenobacter daecheongensis DSM 21074 TaxID=1121955 RepID=A0A1M6AJZ5_9BACT|nr:outer membrane beta-barrel protein [Hymenobacter daecheongensis]SHI36751.1 Outer membrane protein beta-barrel domain-containing protein [Hymenobacter daecheongensis DSM 21074]